MKTIMNAVELRTIAQVQVFLDGAQRVVFGRRTSGEHGQYCMAYKSTGDARTAQEHDTCRYRRGLTIGIEEREAGIREKPDQTIRFGSQKKRFP